MNINWKSIREYIIMTLLSAVAIIWTVVLISISRKIKPEPTGSDYVVRNEYLLDYYHTKSEIIDEVQNYIDSRAPGSDLSAMILVEKCDEFEIDVRFALVQGLKESHFGTKGLAARTNSVWNVYAYDGHSYSEISPKGKYKHPNESIEPYLRLLKTNYLVDKTEFDLLENYVDVNGCRYATAENYERDLTNEINKFEGTKLDSLLIIYNKQKLRLKR